MKITSNKKEDILKRKAEYEAEQALKQKEYDEQYDKWEQAREAVFDPVKKELEELFAKYPLLDADITVEDGRFGEDSLRVRISCNEINKSDSALSWSYDAYFNKGELIRETNSWSGMTAVTKDQVAELEQCVGVLKELVDLDWDGLLKRDLPKYSDYITVSDPKYGPKPDFNKELQEAEIEDIIGERKLIEVKPFSGSWYSDPNKSRWANNVFIGIIKDSGSQYTIIECPKSAYERGEASKYFDSASTHRVKKDSIVVQKPINIVEV